MVQEYAADRGLQLHLNRRQVGSSSAFGPLSGMPVIRSRSSQPGHSLIASSHSPFGKHLASVHSVVTEIRWTLLLRTLFNGLAESEYVPIGVTHVHLPLANPSGHLGRAPSTCHYYPELFQFAGLQARAFTPSLRLVGSTAVVLTLRHCNCSAHLRIHNRSCKRLRTEIDSIAANRRFRSLRRPWAGSGGLRKQRSIGNWIDQRGTSQISPSALERRKFIPTVAVASCWSLLRASTLLSCSCLTGIKEDSKFAQETSCGQPTTATYEA